MTTAHEVIDAPIPQELARIVTLTAGTREAVGGLIASKVALCRGLFELAQVDSSEGYKKSVTAEMDKWTRIAAEWKAAAL